MKKLLCILLSLCIATAFCGCRQDPAQPTSAPTTPPASLPDTTAIVLKYVTEEKLADNGALLGTVSYQIPSVYMADLANASLIYEDLLARIEARKVQSKEVFALANEHYSPDDPWQPYYYECLYTPARMDSAVISLSGKSSSYSGGVHPNHWLHSVTYDAATGKVLALADVLKNAGNLDWLCTYVLDALSNLGEDYFLFDDYVQVVKARFTPDGAGYGSWYFSGTGLALYFSTYEIAPYAAGDIVIEVPYAELNDIVKQEYLPAAPAASGGLLIAENTEQAFQPIKVEVDPDGAEILLLPEGTVTDVTIQQGSWTGDGSLFLVSATLMRANCMTEDNAILLTANIPEDSPTLRISYTSNGEEHICFLVLLDGEPTLVSIKTLID